MFKIYTVYVLYRKKYINVCVLFLTLSSNKIVTRIILKIPDPMLPQAYTSVKNCYKPVQLSHRLEVSLLIKKKKNWIIYLNIKFPGSDILCVICKFCSKHEFFVSLGSYSFY